MAITYQYGNNLYLNITNLCSCNCSFCIRRGGDTVGDSDSLWMEQDPSLEDILAELDHRDLSRYGEIVFCGYGEPTERLDVMLNVCRFLKNRPNPPKIRLNTNGLGDLINNRETAPLLKGLVDCVSVSLNAPTEDRYIEVVEPAFGRPSFSAMLEFARQCKKYVPQVVFSIVDVLSPDETGDAQNLAQRMDIPLRIRVKS